MNISIRKHFWISTIILFLLGCFLELSDQEAYYWLWSRKWDLCYYEHPPMQAWLTHISTILFGNSAAAIRLPGALFRVWGFYATLKWLKQHLGSASTKIEELSAWTLMASFFFLAAAFIALPDVFAFPFAALTMYYAEKRKPWQCGLALGLCALAKWTAATLIPGVFWAFCFSGSDSWKKKLQHILMVSGLSFFLQLPVLVWNSQHHWASFAFHLYKRHERASLEFSQILQNAIAFFLSQFVLGGFSLIVLLGFVLFYRKKYKAQISTFPLLVWILPAFFIFGYSALRGELRFYWTSLAFLPLITLLAKKAQFWPESSKKWFIKIQVGVLYFLVFLVIGLMEFPVGAYLKSVTDHYKAYDLRHSPRGDLVGWKEFVELDLRPTGWVADDVIYLASDFRLAAQMAWALGIDDVGRVGTWRKEQFQFAFWPHRSPGKEIKRAVFVGDNRRKTDNFANDYCMHGLDWKRRDIFLKGELVKWISWTTCNVYKWPVQGPAWQ